MYRGSAAGSPSALRSWATTRVMAFSVTVVSFQTASSSSCFSTRRPRHSIRKTRRSIALGSMATGWPAFRTRKASGSTRTSPNSKTDPILGVANHLATRRCYAGAGRPSTTHGTPRPGRQLITPSSKQNRSIRTPSRRRPLPGAPFRQVLRQEDGMGRPARFGNWTTGIGLAALSLICRSAPADTSVVIQDGGGPFRRGAGARRQPRPLRVPARHGHEHDRGRYRARPAARSAPHRPRVGDQPRRRQGRASGPASEPDPGTEDGRRPGGALHGSGRAPSADRLGARRRGPAVPVPVQLPALLRGPTPRVRRRERSGSSTPWGAAPVRQPRGPDGGRLRGRNPWPEPARGSSWTRAPRSRFSSTDGRRGRGSMSNRTMERFPS